MVFKRFDERWTVCSIKNEIKINCFEVFFILCEIKLKAIIDV